jgi:regulator of protease activity HflC (stomatin/prohibitin superfamily)
MIEYIGYGLLAFVGLIFLNGIRIINQYERGVKLTFGKYSGVMDAGFRFLFPIVQTMTKVDIRQRTIDLPPQDVMTKDKVNLKIDGLVFYTIEEPEKAVLNVSDLKYQLSGKATSELKELIGNYTMSESLSNREKIAQELMKQLNRAVKDEEGGDEEGRKDWGVKIRAVQINNIELPESLVRAMAKQAEAEREREARITKASGEFEASKKFREASNEYASNPIAIRLRELQTYQEIGTEHNTLMMVIPETMVNSNSNWLLSAGMDEFNKVNKKK